jgi:thiol-disulfide isomerase/thioredoxin
MKNILKILSGCLVVFALYATNARADGTNRTAEDEWSALTNFSMPQPPMNWQTNPPTEEQLAKFDDEEADQAGALADRDRDFYTRFPDDTNVPRARTTEIQALQMAVHFGATNRLADLNLRETAMIADTNAPEELRYELRIDQLGRELQATPAAGADRNAEMEKIGRALVQEFPNGPMGYQLLLNITVSCDLLKMQELAKLMANSGGPPELTGYGKGLLNQLEIIGKPSPIEFTTADGLRINSTALSNKVVLVDFWAKWCPICVAAIPDIKKLYDQYHANGLEIVGINFDDDPTQARQFCKEQDMPWPQYFGGYGADNKYGREYGTVLPYVWLVDKKGIVRDIHGRVDLEAKVAKLMAE